MLRLFDHLFATYRPPERERDPQYVRALGQRTLFQVVGVVSEQERVGHVGEPALMPRDLRDGTARLLPHRLPLSHVANVEPAPPEAGQVIYGGQAFGMGGG